jgi:hypothetical protein
MKKIAPCKSATTTKKTFNIKIPFENILEK